MLHYKLFTTSSRGVLRKIPALLACGVPEEFVCVEVSRPEADGAAAEGNCRARPSVSSIPGAEQGADWSECSPAQHCSVLQYRAAAQTDC